MKKIIFCGITNLIFLSAITIAQVSNPVADTEMRDGSSIRRRSIELERVKRESNRLTRTEDLNERTIRFAEIKEDFENIQKLQSEIVKAYTHGKKINYEKISASAAEMTKKAARLDVNLFNSKAEKLDKNDTVGNANQKSVRNLIIELDKAIGDFIGSPIFKNTKLIDPQTSRKSGIELEILMKLSMALSKEANKMK